MRLENTGGEVLSSQNELMDNAKIHEPGSSDIPIHFDIKVKLESKNKKIQEKLSQR